MIAMVCHLQEIRTLLVSIARILKNMIVKQKIGRNQDIANLVIGAAKTTKPHSATIFTYLPALREWGFNSPCQPVYTTNVCKILCYLTLGKIRLTYC